MIEPHVVDEVEELASDADRRYFDAHPGETERIRVAFPGELDGRAAWVRVAVLGPGLRVRMPWVGR